MTIEWSCGSCSAKFPSREAFLGHREIDHPELHAGAIAYDATLKATDDEDAARDAEEAAIREYRAAVRS